MSNLDSTKNCKHGAKIFQLDSVVVAYPSIMVFVVYYLFNRAHGDYSTSLMCPVQVRFVERIGLQQR